MNHHGALLGVVGCGIFQLKALWQVVVHLNGAELPATSYGILYHTVKLRAIEGCLACLLAGIEAALCTGIDNGLLCALPHLVGSDVLLLVVRVTQGNLELYLVVLETEDGEYGLYDVEHAQELCLHLVRAAEDVCVILSE